MVKNSPVAQGKSKALIRSRPLVQVQPGLLGVYYGNLLNLVVAGIRNMASCTMDGQEAVLMLFISPEAILVISILAILFIGIAIIVFVLSILTEG